MRTWFKIWAAPLLLLLVYGCVSTGVREINDPTLTARIEAGKSTQAEVTALLGFPTRVTYGQKGQETWEYYYLTEYPHLPQFIPVVDAFVPGLYQCTRVLTLSFDRQGVVQNLQPGQTTGLAEVWPY